MNMARLAIATLAGMSVSGYGLLAQDAPPVKADSVVSITVPPDAPKGKVRIGIGTVRVLPSLGQQLAHNDQGLSIQRTVETIEGQLIDALQNTRKFEIIARSDLDELLKEQNLRPGLVVDSADPQAAVPARIKGLKYLVLTTIDDFSDVEQSTFSQQMGLAVSRRMMRMSALVRVYDTSTGVLMESMAVPVEMQATGTARAAVGDQMKNPKATDDSAYVQLINQLAHMVAQRAVDAIYPAKVIAVTGDFVTINRGAGTTIDRNQLWEVFTTGRELKDPDTGESLGKEEMKIGEVVITDVLPKFAKGQAYGPNQGMAVGAIVRPKVQIQPVTAPGAVAPAPGNLMAPATPGVPNQIVPPAR